ncbi:hypothetical protein RclHR1_10770004 [Rhizophagus clarus]|uniref:Uncharacterized protein n=1 Tax=Rhizophagus clarus TaxID=94130 RepID=A0A2Z6QTV6_9GLOM|nr:hypothetical protein RclHR1_10770004 [Rhizophagus clarus]
MEPSSIKMVKEEITSTLQTQTTSLVRNLLHRIPELAKGITVIPLSMVHLYDNFCDYQVDIGLKQVISKANTQQIVVANVLGSVCFLFSSVFLDTIIFPALDQISREVEKQIEVINITHQLKLAKKKTYKEITHQSPPDNLPKMDIDKEAQHQSNIASSIPLPPNLDSLTKLVTS